MARVTGHVLVGLMVLAVAAIAVPAPVAAHDPDCVLASHFFGIHVHLECTGYANDDSECLLHAKLFGIKIDLC